MDEPSGFRLGSVAGTSIYVQVTFLILAALFVMFALEGGAPVREALLWIPILLVGILFHELGHAVTIALLGFGSSQIILGGFGGLTVNARRSRPWQEILISAAGPLFSILLAILLSFAFMSIGFLRRDPMLGALLPLMVTANWAWAIFNLIPIYPLDGGQIFKNLSRYFTTNERAVRISAITSLVLAVAITLFAILKGNFFMAAIGGMLALQNYQRLQIGDPEV